MSTFFSWNVNGLRKLDKIDNVISIAKTNNVDFFALQETFWDNDITELVRSKWDGEVIVNNCKDKNRRGVAILVHPKYKNMTKKLHSDIEGRILKVRIESNLECYDVYVIYAANIEVERIKILKKIEENIIDDTPFFYYRRF